MFVEVPIALIFFCFTFQEAVITNFILYRSCYVLLGFNESECSLLGTSNATNETSRIEEQVQPTASVILMTNNIVCNLLPILLSFIIGPWSNKHGRKPFLVLSFAGYFISYVVITALCLFDWISPWWILLSCISLTLGGGACATLTMSFCYISDITTESNRATRMGLLEISLMIGAIIGSVSSSYAFAQIGYVGMYATCSLFSLLATLYVVYFIKESVREVENEGYVKDLLDVSVVVKSFKICFKRRQNHDRTILCLLITVLVLYVFVVFSDSSVFFLYVRERFHWSLRKFTLYSSASSLSGICGMFFALYVLNKYLKIKDVYIIVFICMTYVASSVLIGLATKDWHIYLSSILRCMAGVIGPLTRSAISKVIPPEELGNVFSISTSLEWSAQLVSGPVYTYLYNKTLSFYPNVYNFLSAILHALNTFIVGTVIAIQKIYPVLDVSYVIHNGDI